MKNKMKINTLLDMILFLAILALFCLKGSWHETLAYTFGGLVICHLVLHGKQFKALLKSDKGRNNAILDIIMFAALLSLFAVKGDVHETLAYTTGFLVIIHVVWHWRQFTVMYRRLIPEVKYQRLVAVIASALIIAILTMPLYVTMGEPGHGNGYGPPGRSQGEHHHGWQE
jgi:hypothetical protein